TYLFSAGGVRGGVIALVAWGGGARLGGGRGPATAVNMVTASLLLFVVFYNVLSAAVARREEGVLQRLRTGEATDAEVLVSLALPSALVTVVMTGVLVLAGFAALDLQLPSSPLLVLAGLLLGVVAHSALALVTATWTRTLESAQVTSLPVIAVCAVGGGFAVPLDALPPAVARVAEFTPLAPVVELLRAGWIGEPTFADVAVWTGTLLGWVVVGVLLVRSGFRWSPRS
ncbi:ABC transporter permease, partial [Kineococcus sp. SYSU DK024]|uniref:ABC transporter permease n=1 Tax=Kineococcus sp. SYSU DK024 TaxID=3383145 RepID=UPI003D7CEAA1